LNGTRDKEENQADYRQEKGGYDLYVDSVNSRFKGELIEEALKGIENLCRRAGDNV